MANQRHPDQRLVAFALPAELLTRLDAARKALGKDRSAYIRVAILEKLDQLGVPLPTALRDSPDRTGKTYRPRTITSYKAEQKAANSKPAGVATKILGKAAASVQRRPAK